MEGCHYSGGECATCYHEAHPGDSIGHWAPTLPVDSTTQSHLYTRQDVIFIASVDSRFLRDYKQLQGRPESFSSLLLMEEAVSYVYEGCKVEGDGVVNSMCDLRAAPRMMLRLRPGEATDVCKQANMSYLYALRCGTFYPKAWLD
ncbi:hypothetical protein QCA50_015391 [Cerrena zonata]|uniref:Uncharacterized protein n=1 Tax=Cerrena zonata TaxID=2478898 RepID=A0AAW0FWH2_9APHY